MILANSSFSLAPYSLRLWQLDWNAADQASASFITSAIKLTQSSLHSATTSTNFSLKFAFLFSQTLLHWKFSRIQIVSSQLGFPWTINSLELQRQESRPGCLPWACTLIDLGCCSSPSCTTWPTVLPPVRTPRLGLGADAHSADAVEVDGYSSPLVCMIWPTLGPSRTTLCHLPEKHNQLIKNLLGCLHTIFTSFLSI